MGEQYFKPCLPVLSLRKLLRSMWLCSPRGDWMSMTSVSSQSRLGVGWGLGSKIVTTFRVSAIASFVEQGNVSIVYLWTTDFMKAPNILHRSQTLLLQAIPSLSLLIPQLLWREHGYILPRVSPWVERLTLGVRILRPFPMSSSDSFEESLRA